MIKLGVAARGVTVAVETYHGTFSVCFDGVQIGCEAGRLEFTAEAWERITDLVTATLTAALKQSEEYAGDYNDLPY